MSLLLVEELIADTGMQVAAHNGDPAAARATGPATGLVVRPEDHRHGPT